MDEALVPRCDQISLGCFLVVFGGAKGRDVGAEKPLKRMNSGDFSSLLLGFVLGLLGSFHWLFFSENGKKR